MLKCRPKSTRRFATHGGPALHSLITCALIVVPIRADEGPSIGTGPGQTYPDFYLPKLDGASSPTGERRFGRLSDYRGKKVLLVHFASW